MGNLSFAGSTPKIEHAGFIREYIEGTEYAKDLYKLGIKNKTLSEV